MNRDERWAPPRRSYGHRCGESVPPFVSRTIASVSDSWTELKSHFPYPKRLFYIPEAMTALASIFVLIVGGRLFALSPDFQRPPFNSHFRCAPRPSPAPLGAFLS